MMRWLFGVLKILCAVFIVGFAVNAIFACTSGIKPYQGIVDKVKDDKGNEPAKENKGNLSSENNEDKVSIEDKNRDSMGNSPQTAESTDKKENPSNTADYFLTYNEINSIENVNVQDKLLGLSIISKINKDDLQKIYKLAEGGITVDELRELKKILDRDLSKGDIQKLDDLLTKNRKLFAEGKLSK